MEKGRKKELEDARKKLASELDKFMQVSRNLLEPLKELNEYQIAALVTLAYSMRVIMLARRPATKIPEGILARFKEVVDEYCPPLRELAISKDPCLEATLSYIEALKKCQDEGLTEDDCPDAWEHGGRAVMCTMKELEEMKGKLGDIFGGLKPPRPLPWPE